MKSLALTIPGTKPGSTVEITAPTGIPSGENFTVSNIASIFLEVAMIIGIFLSLGYLIYGGIYIIQTGGDKQKLDKGRRTIIYAIMGLVVMSLALVIINVFATALGIQTAVDLFR